MRPTLAALILIVVGSPALAQNDSVRFLGLSLQLGMSKDSVLAKLSSNPDVGLTKIKDEWYTVAAKDAVRDVWEDVGDLFTGTKLTRIGLSQYNESDKSATIVARAIYSAVTAAGKPSDVWTRFNQDANSPVYETHFGFSRSRNRDRFSLEPWKRRR